MLTPYFRLWLKSFAFTQIIEVPIYAMALPCYPRARYVVGFGASLITHPVLWITYSSIQRGVHHWLHGSAHEAYWVTLALTEIAVTLIEGIYLSCWTVRRLWHVEHVGGRKWPVQLPHALAWSLFANGASLGLGLLSRFLFNVP